MKNVHIVTSNFGIIDSNSLIVPKQSVDNINITFASYNDSNILNNRKNALHPRLKGKIPKMLEWMNVDADYYIWLDAPFEIVSEHFIQNTLNSLGDSDICMCKHNARNTIKDEFNFVDSLMKNGNEYLNSRYSGEAMKEQVDVYLNDSTFVDTNLFEMGFFVYSKKLIENRDYNLMTDWFFHNCYYSVQDQLSIPYLLHKHKINYSTFEFDVFHNPDAKYIFK